MPETPDLNAERLAALKALMPDIFTDEGKINENELRKIVDEVPGNERYEFKWFGKTKAKHDAFTPTRLTLTYDEARSINADKSENIIIEGENLEVLKLLLCGYREQIKCIYIDPPYNTGRDFVYSDKHAIEYHEYLEKTAAKIDGVKSDANPETSGRFHSDWLSMMYSRLLIARQLLKDDGVIFISIDDHEVENLRKLCDEVFNEQNFIDSFIWRSRLGKGSTSLQTARLHEYILCYAKQAEMLDFLPDSRISETDSSERLRQWGQGDRREDRKTMYFGIESEEFGTVYPVKPDGNDGRWRVGKESMDKLLADGLVVFEKQDDGRIEPYRLIPKGSVTETAQDSILGPDVKTTAHGSKQITTLFGKKVFDYAKPTTLIKHFVKITDDPDAIYLDFFAGSGVTGQAVTEMNLEDHGNRRFILVQFPELTGEKSEAFKAGYKTISSVTIDRNKLFIEKTAKEDEGLGFKVFTLEKSYFPRTEWTPEPEMTEDEKIASLRAYIDEKEKQLRINFDSDKLLTEVLIKEGFKLTYKTTKHPDFAENEVLNITDGEKTAVVCLDETLTDATVEQLRKLIDSKVVVIERALDTTKKWNLHNSLGEKFRAF